MFWLIQRPHILLQIRSDTLHLVPNGKLRRYCEQNRRAAQSGVVIHVRPLSVDKRRGLHHIIAEGIPRWVQLVDNDGLQYVVGDRPVCGKVHRTPTPKLIPPSPFLILTSPFYAVPRYSPSNLQLQIRSLAYIHAYMLHAERGSPSHGRKQCGCTTSS